MHSTKYKDMVNACLFPTSKVFDSKGNILELHDLLHNTRVGYDWRKVASLYLSFLCDKYNEAGSFLEASIIPIEVCFSPYQLVILEVISY